MTANKNGKVSAIKLKDLNEPWAKGFKKGNTTIYHPYTKIGFKFNNNG
jgi:hypothetical protein